MMDLFDRKYSKNSNTLKYYNLKEQISTLIYLKMWFIPVIEFWVRFLSMNLQQPDTCVSVTFRDVF